MKNEVKWKGHTIYRWVAVFEHNEPIAEFDSMGDAKAYFSGTTGYEFKYAAAEVIDKDGNVNIAVYGNTLKEAMDNLRETFEAQKVYVVFKRNILDESRDEVVGVYATPEAASKYCNDNYMCWFCEYSVRNK